MGFNGPRFSFNGMFQFPYIALDEAKLNFFILYFFAILIVFSVVKKVFSKSTKSFSIPASISELAAKCHISSILYLPNFS